MNLNKHRRGRYRPTKEDVKRERKLRRAVAAETKRAGEVKMSLRERLDPRHGRYTYDEHGREACQA